MNVKERRINLLQLSNGQCPFERWLRRLPPLMQRAVDARLTRVAAGNFGDHKAVGAGVYELRIPKGSGLRIYYGLGREGDVIIIAAGNKAEQNRDIQRAKDLWRNRRDEDERL